MVKFKSNENDDCYQKEVGGLYVIGSYFLCQKQGEQYRTPKPASAVREQYRTYNRCHIGNGIGPIQVTSFNINKIIRRKRNSDCSYRSEPWPNTQYAE